MARLKIDVQNKLIEIEGSEAFIQDTYNKSKPLFENDHQNSETEVITKRQHRNGIFKESYSIVKTLNLSSPQSLMEFYKTKKAPSALERNTLFIYYLEKIAGIQNIGLNHIYTCYKETNAKMPKALRQSLLDTASKKGWLITKKMTDIRISTRGEYLVEHELA